MHLVQISNHPEHPEITRKISRCLFREDEKNRIRLKCKVHHFINDVEVLEMAREVVLMVDNSQRFDQNGNYVDQYLPDGSENPAWPTAVGDYDFMMNQLPNDLQKTLSAHLFEIEDAFILKLDQERQRFNY